MDLHRHPDLLDRLAAAYALGTLRGGARRRFETLARRHAVVRAAALVWQERFAGMTELQPQAAPHPNVWKRIENLLQAEDGAGARATDERGVLAQLRRRLGWWRGAAVAGACAAAAVAVVSVQLGRSLQDRDSQLAQLEARPDIQYVAVLADDKSSASFLVTFDPRRRTLTLKRVGPVQVGDDKSLELWALPPGQPPRSLGVMGTDPVVRLTAAEQQVREVPALAVTLEPRGGAPEGKPTGPVLFKGALLQAPV
jgi:anti-sigma-K factor RskA